MNIFIKYGFRGTAILLFQVLILNEITLRWWVQPEGFPVFIPQVYPLFLLLLPFNSPRQGVLILGFITGLIMDAFMNTVAMHAFATTALAYFRYPLLNAFLPKHLSEYGDQAPNGKNMGSIPFLAYLSLLVFFHHSLYFILELWSFASLSYLLIKILASGATSLLIICAILLLFSKKSRSWN